MQHRVTGTFGRARRTALAGAVLAIGFEGAALAGELKPSALRPPPSTGVEIFDDWKKVCETPPGATERVCFIFQKVNFAETESTLLQAVVGYFRSDVPDPVLILTAPLGTFLPPGIELRVEGGEPLRSHFEVCMAIGCQASLRLDSRNLTRLSNHPGAEVIVRDGAKKQVSIPLSLKGLERGLASLKPKN